MYTWNMFTGLLESVTNIQIKGLLCTIIKVAKQKMSYNHENVILALFDTCTCICEKCFCGEKHIF